MKMTGTGKSHGKLALCIAMALLAGCHSQKGLVKPSVNSTPVTFTPGKPHLLLLSGTISYDSLTATYEMEIASQKYVDGYVNIHSKSTEITDLHYVQLAADSTVLSRQAMDNPLLRDVEFLGEKGFEHKVSILPRADFYLRIQLEKDVRLIKFFNGQRAIKQIKIAT